MIFKGIDEIADLFNNSRSMDDAHEKARSILAEWVKDPEFIFSVIRQNLSDPSYLKKKRHYPTLALEVYKNDLIDIVINIFPSLPNKRTNLSFQSIHHHGSLKLSTIGLSGPGYSSCLFKGGYSIDPESNETSLKLDAFYQNKIGQYTFCDAYIPHVVFYPTQMSSTLVLWSKQKSSTINSIKALFPRSFSKKTGPVLNKLGLRKALDLNVAEYHDFYPKNGKFYALKNRIGYPEGSNENFVQNVFHYMKTVGFNDFDFLQNLKQEVTTTEIVKKWIDKFCNQETIDAKFEESHLTVGSKVNVVLEEIQLAFEGN